MNRELAKSIIFETLSMTDPIENILQLVQQIGDAKIREELLKITGKIAESNSYLIFEIEKIYPDLNPDL